MFLLLTALSLLWILLNIPASDNVSFGLMKVLFLILLKSTVRVPETIFGHQDTGTFFAFRTQQLPSVGRDGSKDDISSIPLLCLYAMW